MSRSTTSPRFTDSSTTTVASSCRRGPYTHASSPSTSRRACASLGLRRTCGPRSLSVMRVPMNCATRNGRLRWSSVMPDADSPHRDVPLVRAHHEPPAVQAVQHRLAFRLAGTQRARQVRRPGAPELVYLLPDRALPVVDYADHARAIIRLEHERQP